MRRRLKLLGMIGTMAIAFFAGCETEEGDNELVALGGKYYAPFMNGAGFVHDMVLVTVTDAHDIRLSSSDGRLVDSPMENITRDGAGSYFGTVQLEDVPTPQSAEVVLVVVDDDFTTFRFTLDDVVVDSSASDLYPWNGVVAGELSYEDGSIAGHFFVDIVTGAANGDVWGTTIGDYELTGFFSDLGLGHFYTVEGWPESGLALLGTLWIEENGGSLIHGSGEWLSVVGGASGTWTSD
jgi:hypothetical protein